MSLNLLTNNSKAVVAVLSAVSIALQTEYPAAKWEPVVIAGIGAFLVWLTPNTKTEVPQNAAIPPG